MSTAIYRASKAELARLLAAGEGYAAIGRLHGVAEGRVRYRVHRLGLGRLIRPQGAMPAEPALRLALSHRDLTLKEIARAFGCEAQTVRRGAELYGLPMDERGRAALMETRS